MEGRLYICEFRQRRVTRTLKNGKTEVLASRFEGKRLNAPNDIIVRRDGHVYFTDPAFGSQQDARELDFYGVFHITPKGELEAVAKWKTRPNGITLSPNGRTLYVSDSDQRLVRAYDLDGKGIASNERVVVERIAGVPDGIRTDEKGNLYVAAKAVYVYSLPGGSNGAKLLGEIGLAETPSNIAFGDADLETLFITARTSVYRVRLGVKGALQY
jgi:gluconolactonase